MDAFGSLFVSLPWKVRSFGLLSCLEEELCLIEEAASFFVRILLLIRGFSSDKNKTKESIHLDNIHND